MTHNLQINGQWRNECSTDSASKRQREQELGERIRWGLILWIKSKVGARFQAISQRRSWILEGMRGNQIVLCGEDVTEGREERTEKKEETEETPLEEGV